MSVTSGFFNSVNHDRQYDAIQMSSIFDGIIRDGVIQHYGSNMMVTASNGMRVNVGIGRAWFDHTWTLNDSVLPLKLDEAELLLNRIDTVVLEVTSSSGTVRQNSIRILKGTPATEPVPPTLTKGELVNQYPLADIYVAIQASAIRQEDITNRVGTSDCPFVTAPLEKMDIDALIAQWQDQFQNRLAENLSEFQAWFDGMKDQLTEDAAGNLQTQLNVAKESLSTLDASAVKSVNGVAPEEGGKVVLSKTDLRLENVDNTADAVKRVAYADTAGSATDQTARNSAATAQTAAVSANANANTKMPIAGGTFTGNVAAINTNRTGNCVRNIYVNGVDTNYIRMVRK